MERREKRGRDRLIRGFIYPCSGDLALFKSTNPIVCFKILLFPIIVVSMSQGPHKMPVHWLPHYNENLPEYLPGVLNGMVKYRVACQ